MIAHILNTIIFAIAGAKLGTLMMNGTLLQIIQLFSWRLFMIYPIVLFTRGFCIFLFFPILKRIGTGCTWQEAVVMWWGGLRGSVGLALGLVVLHTSYDANMWGLDSHTVEGAPGDGFSLDCRDQPVVVLFMNMIVVFFTVVVNGISMAPLMRYLKMTAIPMDRRFQLNTAYLHLRRETEAKLAKLITAAEKGAKGARHYHGADWAYVYRKIVKHHELFTDVDDVKRAAWMSVLTMERASYLAQFEAGRLSAEAFLALEGFMATLVADASRAATDQASALASHLPLASHPHPPVASPPHPPLASSLPSSPSLGLLPPLLTLPWASSVPSSRASTTTSSTCCSSGCARPRPSSRSRSTRPSCTPCTWRTTRRKRRCSTRGPFHSHLLSHSRR